MTMLQLRGPIRSCVLPWWLFIAVDTLCQHPMRTGHMTVLQSCGLMEFCVLQWCHPMPARAEGGQAVVPGSLPCMVRESGFRPAHTVSLFIFMHAGYLPVVTLCCDPLTILKVAHDSMTQTPFNETVLTFDLNCSDILFITTRPRCCGKVMLSVVTFHQSIIVSTGEGPM